MTVEEAKEILIAEKLALHTELRNALLASDAKTSDLAKPITEKHRSDNAEAIIQAKLLQFEIASVEKEVEEAKVSVDTVEAYEHMEPGSQQRLEARIRAQEAKKISKPTE
ncbi:hypothetical protein G0Q06_13025 [Puniceicoccales bacterium CK1056]|uniref:Uncharacterized protein n=1 Tax=Oceanipulchritudo coccoides TaxID=2706888 RepID=A0A6B2M2Y9_9BACT|nr:hypothetical protein [Oceanipulchritudo coccoides]NDV63381.1 hypothetical protein [Oceanipulchritudo coccoides]